MKNSKRFSSRPGERLDEHPLLSPSQHALCATLCRCPPGQMTLSAISLGPLGGEAGIPLAEAYLTADEQACLASFPLSKRRREWLGGRVAAKRAAMRLWANAGQPPRPYQALRIASQASGRPFLCLASDQAGPPPHISISHSGELAVALASQDLLCGLDLQQIAPRILTVRERFASEAEATLLHTTLPALPELHALTLLWSAKEALRKAIPCQPLLGFTEVTLGHLDGDPHRGLTAELTGPRLPPPGRLPVFLFLHADYACAITMLDLP